MTTERDLCAVCKHERGKHDENGCNFQAAIPDKAERVCGAIGDWHRYKGPRCTGFVEPSTSTEGAS